MRCCCKGSEAVGNSDSVLLLVVASVGRDRKPSFGISSLRCSLHFVGAAVELSGESLGGALGLVVGPTICGGSSCCGGIPKVKG